MGETTPKILIVDDEKPLANALKIKFSAAGFDASMVNNGNEALATLGKETFDILILDLIMPRLDGFGVLKEMKDKGITMPVIVASNLGQDSDILRAKQLGAVDYFIKSDLSIEEIIKKVKKQLNLT